jgi:RNA polymerase sigma-70 factor (ECF subfamily)
MLAVAIDLDTDASAAAPPELPPSSLESALVRRAVAGDDDAFRRLFERHAAAVRRFLGDLLRDDSAADEGVQETFVRAHARLGTLREQDKLLPWLFAIARNVFYEELRARRRRAANDAAALDEEIDRSPSPEGLLMGREADTLLGEALAELGEERRAALVLRIDHGLDYDEIAGIMGWPLSKVKNEIHRARLSLRSRLCKYVGDKG